MSQALLHSTQIERYMNTDDDCDWRSCARPLNPLCSVAVSIATKANEDGDFAYSDINCAVYNIYDIHFRLFSIIVCA